MLVDEVRITVKAGDGGNGCLAFRREKYVPRGGPSGGDGGRGGDVTMVATIHRNTLLHFRFNPEYTAQRGRHGEGSNRTGPRRRKRHRSGAGRHHRLRRRNRRAAVRFHRRRPDLARGQRRTRRTRQCALRHLHPSGAHRARRRQTGRIQKAAAEAEAAGRCRAGRLSQRRASRR